MRLLGQKTQNRHFSGEGKERVCSTSQPMGLGTKGRGSRIHLRGCRRSVTRLPSEREAEGTLTEQSEERGYFADGGT